jgi:hypothetical protein
MRLVIVLLESVESACGSAVNYVSAFTPTVRWISDGLTPCRKEAKDGQQREHN